LPKVLKEITEKLLQDDWHRMSTEDGARKYYIVGNEDQEADLVGIADFSRSQYPIPTRPGPLSEWAVRAQVADNRKDYLKHARTSLEKAGVPAAAIDRFIESGMEDLSGWKWDPGLSVEERARLCSNVLQACLSYSEAQSVELDTDEVVEANIAREKICLAEVTNKLSVKAI